ncbi:MAG: hypothetical protein VYD34_03765 [Verrucomicrobiota bacterium]|nr:hypothetical protein [Verrucomicrobiota bacterium]MEE2813462.1 hypothetical protein [Verrucomicrobiota bacterium]
MKYKVTGLCFLAISISCVLDIGRTSPSLENYNQLVHPENIDSFVVTGFDQLSDFSFKVPDFPRTDSKAQEILKGNKIPALVKCLSGQKVAIQGFMFPLRYSDGKVTQFLILRDQSWCCYGTIPEVTEWVVAVSESGFKPVLDVPINFYGKFIVGEQYDKNDFLVGIYKMECSSIGPPIPLVTAVDK